MSYLVHRLLLALAQLGALSLLAFLLSSVAPGHFFSAEAADPARSESTLNALARSHGLDRPWPERYLTWLRSCAGDGCGRSLAYGLPASELIAERAPRTLAVVVPAWFLAWMGGLALAFLGTARKPVLAAMEALAVIAALLPDLLLGSFLLWLAVFRGWPVSGVWIPVAVTAVPLGAVVFLHASGALAAASEARFVRLARIRGLPRWLIWRSYIFPAAGNPLISLLAPSLVGAVSATLAVEAFTGWPGLGPLFLDAYRARDYPVVQAVFLTLSAAMTLSNFAADLLLFRLDPRIRVHDETPQ